MTRNHVNNYTLSVSGIRIDLDNPKASMFNIQDISHALGHVNRFNGNLPIPYSVAQHSVMVSHLVPQEYALEGLMHDGSEAVLCDIPTPVKRMLPHAGNVCGRLVEAFQSCALPEALRAAMQQLLQEDGVKQVVANAIPGYVDLEARIQAAIHESVGLPHELRPEVVAYIKRADAVALATEKRDLMWADDGEWPILARVKPAVERIIPLSAGAAIELFRARYREIMQARAQRAA